MGGTGRVGLHCAPSAHRTIDTFPHGTLRIAPGFFTSINDINNVISAVDKIAKA
jgi:selenocysteine lyase/cysteine desulfurase